VTAGPRPVLHHEVEVMGTVVTIDLFGETHGARTREPLDRLVDAACAVLHDADAVFSTWREDSPISRLRRGELTVDACPPVVGEVLSRCAEAHATSMGWFDPWALPGGVDPTGLVKGWAAQLALSQLLGTGVEGAIVNAAGDVAAWGAPAPGQPFRIGIVDPFDPSRLACVVELDGARGGAIATSGTYERGPHLIDPRTAERASAVASATVRGPDLGLADALATAVAVSGTVDFVDAVEGYEAFVIGLDGRACSTPRFAFATDPVVVRH
jgi:thiamine biosynthesis lipoprotein